ncbi:MAG: DNA methyltransferase [Bacteroidetes bacterium]|nr:DNA methyltransferase [Bacteroidota bacterium]
MIHRPYGDKSGKRDSHYKRDEDGRWFRWQKLRGKEPYKIYLSDKGRRLGEVWSISHINASAKERTGYPTQKPISLYERIIKASSNEGDIVLDCFAGCATTCVAAERLNRQWVGIDIWDKAHDVVVDRLRKEVGVFGEVTYTQELPD